MKLRALGFLILGTLLLAGCGGSGDEPEDASTEPFTEQEVAWESCDAQFTEGAQEVLALLEDRLECATVQTPLSWDDPGRDSVNLGLLRVRAADPEKRQGAIFLNPGGPGGDGLVIAAVFGLIFTAPESRGVPDYESFADLSESYDLIGFSPRGVGESFRLYCGSNKRFPADVGLYDTSEENLNALLLGSSYVADACQANPLSEYINTEQTVRDMDLIRQLLGDEKLNYLGFSYGSWLGAWYAKTFPERAGNMVLDANTQFSGTFQDVFGLQPLGFNRAFKNVALAYAARNNDIYGLGTTKEEAFDVFLSLPNEVKEALTIGTIDVGQDLYSSSAVPEVGFKLRAAQGVAEVLNILGPDAELGELLDVVAAYPYLENEENNEKVAGYAIDIAFDIYDARDAVPSPIELSAGSAVFRAITCNDTPWSSDPADYKAAARASAEAYPFDGVSLALAPCAFWSGDPVTKPDTPDNLPPILMVQTGFDAATPAEGALEAFESLPDAHLVYIENEMSHAAFPYGTACVDEKVAAYLLSGELPSERVSNCAALPLPGEMQVYPPEGGVSPQGASAPTETALRSVENPLYDLVHELIRENAADFYGHDRIRGEGRER